MDSTGLLEWEFSLPPNQIISHGWYHGSLSRVAAENFLNQDREFLVRDSSSQPSNYVLSCRCNAQYLHFVIQRVVIQQQTVFERIQYQFEDEAYDTVADLITSYVGSEKPISAASGAKIQYPVNRQIPLTNFIQKPNLLSYSVKNVLTSQSVYSGLAHQPETQIKVSVNPHKFNLQTPMDKIQPHNYIGNNEIIMNNENKCIKYNPCDHHYSSNILTYMMNPPAKPARSECSKADDRPVDLQRHYHVSGSDSGNGSTDSSFSSTLSSLNQSKVHSGHRTVTSDFSKSNFELSEVALLENLYLDYTVVLRDDKSNIKFALLEMNLIKPLESETLHRIKHLLRTSGARILANHLTKVDLCYLFDNTLQLEGFKATASRLELSFLPQGKSLRVNVIERIETFRLLVAVTILTCQTDQQRADTINDWILLAIETKTALGNLHGFSAIMFGLCMPQVECLINAWNIMRQQYTNNAFMFEAKLRPCFKSMNEGTNPLPPNTTSPYILPPVLCLHLFDGDGYNAIPPNDYFPTSLLKNLEFDFNATNAHLEAARIFPNQLDMFKRNARIVIHETTSLGPALNPLLLELFRTEFHINFLWGEKGAFATSNQRFARLIDILSNMAIKLTK